jgi:hypothetical protein
MSEYTRECISEDEEFILYRARASAAELPLGLLPIPCSTRPTVASLKKIGYEYSFRVDLDRTWAIRPVALSGCKRQGALVLEDPGREPLDRMIRGPFITVSPKTHQDNSWIP